MWYKMLEKVRAEVKALTKATNATRGEIVKLRKAITKLTEAIEGEKRG